MLSDETFPLEKKWIEEKSVSIPPKHSICPMYFHIQTYSFGTIDSPHLITTLFSCCSVMMVMKKIPVSPLWFLCSQLLQCSCSHMIKIQALHNCWVFKTIAVSCGHYAHLWASQQGQWRNKIHCKIASCSYIMSHLMGT